MKTCKRCQQAKPFAAFRADPRYRDGFGSWCLQCHRERNSEWAKENRERLNRKAADWRAANPDKYAETTLRSSRKHAEKRLAYSAEWAKKNPEKRRLIDAKRKAAKLRAIPSWADHAAIAAIYAATPEGHQVDHIVPLVSEFVCGLHWEANLSTQLDGNRDLQ